MNSDIKDLELCRWLIYFQCGLFILFFVVGFLDLGGWLLLTLMVPFLFLAIVLLILALKIKQPNPSIGWIMVTAIAAIIFSLGMSYGIFGIWGYYEINDYLYVSNVGISLVGFLIGAAGSLYFLHRKDHQSAGN